MEGATVEGELAEGSVEESVEEGMSGRVSRGNSCAVCLGICPVIHRGADLYEGGACKGCPLHCTAINCYEAKNVAHICR